MKGWMHSEWHPLYSSPLTPRFPGESLYMDYKIAKKIMHVQTIGISRSSVYHQPSTCKYVLSMQKKVSWMKKGLTGVLWLVSSKQEFSRSCAETTAFLSKGPAAGLTQNYGRLCACSSSASLLKCQSQLLSALGSAWTRYSQSSASSAKKPGDSTTGFSFSPKWKSACHPRGHFGSHLHLQSLINVGIHYYEWESRLLTPYTVLWAIVWDLSSDLLK